MTSWCVTQFCNSEITEALKRWHQFEVRRLLEEIWYMLQTLFTQKYLLTARLQMLNLKKQSQKTAKINLLYPWFYSDTDNGIQQFRQGKKFKNLYSIFFSIRVFFHWRFTGQQRKGRNYLFPLYHFYPLINIQTFICNFTSDYCNIFITTRL